MPQSKTAPLVWGACLFLASCAGEPLPSPGWKEAPPEVLAASSVSGKLRAGASRASIDPPYAVPLAGYFAASWFRLRELRDPLFARALVLEEGGLRIALVTVDRVLIPPALRDAVEARDEFRRAKVQAWMIGATHTHAGPGGYVEAWPAEMLGLGSYDPLLFAHLAERVAKAIEGAALALRVAGVEAGSVKLAPDAAKSIGFNRREPEVPGDPELDVLAFTSGTAPTGQQTLLEEKVTVARFLRFAAHPTVIPSYLRRSSGDYPGVLCRTLEERDGGVALFAQGASGDLAAGAPGDTPVAGWQRRVERIGKRLAREALQLEAQLTPQVDSVPLSHLSERIQLPPREPWSVPFVGRDIASKYPERVMLQCLRIGNALLLTFPGEMGRSLGEKIVEAARSATGASQVIVWTLADDYMGYAFAKEDFEKGGKGQHLTAYGPELGGFLEERMVALAKGCWEMKAAGQAPVEPPAKQGD